jgi:hypothetical protein
VQVVPVEEVAAEALHPLERGEGELQAARHLAGGDEAEVVGAHDRQEVEADVGRGGAHRDHRRGSSWKLSGDEPVRLRADEAVEVAPVQQREPRGPVPVRAAELPLAGAEGALSACAISGEATQRASSGPTARASCQAGAAAPPSAAAVAPRPAAPATATAGPIARHASRAVPETLRSASRRSATRAGSAG